MRPPLCRWTGGGGRTLLRFPCVDSRPRPSVSGCRSGETSGPPPLLLLGARLLAAPAQRPAQGQLLLRRPLLVGARRLEDHREPVEARLAEEHGAAVLAQLTLPD